MRYRPIGEVSPGAYFRIHGKLYRKLDITKSKGMYCIGSEKGPNHGVAFDFDTSATVEFPGGCPVEETQVHIVDEADVKATDEEAAGETNPDSPEGSPDLRC